MKEFSTKDGTILLLATAFVAVSLIALYAVDTVNFILDLM